jgi:hypothetical protein
VVPGKAKVTVELESSTGKKGAPSELEVTIEKGHNEGRSHD